MHRTRLLVENPQDGELCYRDGQNRDRYGPVLALNQKTVTILTGDQQQWRAAYEFLFPVKKIRAAAAFSDCGDSPAPSGGGPNRAELDYLLLGDPFFIKSLVFHW